MKKAVTAWRVPVVVGIGLAIAVAVAMHVSRAGGGVLVLSGPWPGLDERGRPLTFLQSAAFQWVNPKAWSMALSAITLYAASRDLPAVLWVAGVYVAMSVISTTSWTVLGQQLRRLLKSPARLRAFSTW